MIFTQTYFKDKIYYIYPVIIIQILNVFFSEAAEEYRKYYRRGLPESEESSERSLASSPIKMSRNEHFSSLFFSSLFVSLFRRGRIVRDIKSFRIAIVRSR